MHNRNEWAEFEIAASLTGAVRGRLNARDSRREWSWTLTDLEPAVVIAGTEFTQTLADICDDRTLQPFEMLVLGADGAVSPRRGRARTSRCVTGPTCRNAASGVTSSMSHVGLVDCSRTISRRPIGHA